MLTPFKMGVGGKIGSGAQYMSWISLLDIPGIFEWMIENKDIHGPVDVVTPYPVTNYEFTKTLGSVLRRPTVFPMPAVVARIILGEMAKELILTSQKISPEKLIQKGFSFRYPQLEQALRALLSKN